MAHLAVFNDKLLALHRPMGAAVAAAAAVGMQACTTLRPHSFQLALYAMQAVGFALALLWGRSACII